jgi:hypothetical protein
MIAGRNGCLEAGTARDHETRLNLAVLVLLHYPAARV